MLTTLRQLTDWLGKNGYYTQETGIATAVVPMSALQLQLLPSES